MNFMDLAEEYSHAKSTFCILPVEYEKDTTYGKGASKGPLEIIKASKHLEYYDDQFDKEPFIEGVQTLPTLSLVDESAKDAMKEVEQNIEKVDDKFIITLGGDHAVTIGAVKGHEKKHKDFSVITFDAHPDFFHSWNGSEYNHRCVSQRLVNKHEVLVVGARSMDKDEHDLIKENKKIDMIKAYDCSVEELSKKIDGLKENVYISIDVDCFDPSFIRNTGTPEPGGFFWNEITDMLALIFEKKQVIGADIVEFSPSSNFDAEAFSLAKLCYKIFALKQKYMKNVSTN